MQTRLLTTKDAANILQVTPRFLQHDRTHKRTIPYIKINKLVRYDKSDLQEFIERSKKGGGEK